MISTRLFFWWDTGVLTAPRLVRVAAVFGSAPTAAALYGEG